MKKILWILKAIPITVGLLIASLAVVLFIGRIDAAVDLEGEIAIERFHVVRPVLGGVITKVYHQPGQPVEKGDILFQLDDYELERELLGLEKELGREESELHRILRESTGLQGKIHPLEYGRDQASLWQLRLEKDKTRARSEELRVELRLATDRQTRQTRLFDAGLVSAEALKESAEAVALAEWRLEQTSIESEQAEATIRAAQERLGLLEASQVQALELLDSRRQEIEHRLERLRVQLDQLRQLKTEMAVRAKIDGIVVGPEQSLLVGSRVESGAEVLTIIDPTSVAFEGLVPEEAILKVKLGQPAMVELIGLPKRQFDVFAGRVEHVDLRPQEGDGVRALYPIKMRLEQSWIAWDSSRFYLRDGMRGKGKVIYQPNLRIAQLLLRTLMGSPSPEGPPRQGEPVQVSRAEAAGHQAEDHPDGI